jgi:NADPH:quinone reductase-like Zn-dependent oxidoreductase
MLDMPDPVRTPQQAVIRAQAAWVNPCEVENVAAAMEATVPPRIPGANRR